MSEPEPAAAPAQPAWSLVWLPWTYWVRTTFAVVATLLVVAAARRWERAEFPRPARAPTAMPPTKRVLVRR